MSQYSEPESASSLISSLAEPSMKVCAGCRKENPSHYKFCLGCGAELDASVAPKPASYPKVRSREEIQETPGLTISKGESSLRLKYTLSGWGLTVMYIAAFLFLAGFFLPVFPWLILKSLVFVFFGFAFLSFLVLVFYLAYLSVPRPDVILVKRPREDGSQDPFRAGYQMNPSEIIIESGLLFRRKQSISSHGLKEVLVALHPEASKPFNQRSFSYRHYSSSYAESRSKGLWSVSAQFEDGRSVVLVPMIGALRSAQAIVFLLEEALGPKEESMPNEIKV